MVLISTILLVVVPMVAGLTAVAARTPERRAGAFRVWESAARVLETFFTPWSHRGHGSRRSRRAAREMRPMFQRSPFPVDTISMRCFVRE
ncbi:hypothetical protein [Rhodococcus sp. NPDC058481]|uniref:hypothetical protein n=1 Tax=unclassified Rhodococcus (in: high G+C Gram-positive bacteria) TaxID=192944 RepID=UPI003649300A